MTLSEVMAKSIWNRRPTKLQKDDNNYENTQKYAAFCFKVQLLFKILTQSFFQCWQNNLDFSNKFTLLVVIKSLDFEILFWLSRQKSMPLSLSFSYTHIHTQTHAANSVSPNFPVLKFLSYNFYISIFLIKQLFLSKLVDFEKRLKMTLG